MLQKLIDFLVCINELYITLKSEFMQKIHHKVMPTEPQVLGDKIVVMGNGPSQELFLQNRNDFEGYDVLCMNSFPQYSEKDFFSIKPRFFCAVDSMLTNIDIAKKVGRVDEYIAIRDIFKKVNWKMSIITWVDADFQILNPHIDIIRINRNICMKMSFTRRRELYLKNRAMIVTETVALPALFFSIIFGYKEIALFGVDHDNFKGIECDEVNKSYVSTWHAYDKEKPDRSPIRTGGEHFIYELFEGYTKAFQAYVECQKLAESVNCHITNYNCKSYVDAFEKSQKYLTEGTINE